MILDRFEIMLITVLAGRDRKGGEGNGTRGVMDLLHISPGSLDNFCGSPEGCIAPEELYRVLYH